MYRFVSKRLKAFRRSEKGVTMIEYGLIAALVALVAIVGLRTIGTSLNTQFGTIGTTITTPGG